MAGKKKPKSKFSGIEGRHKSTGIEYHSGLEKKFLDQCYMMGIKVARCKDTVPYIDASGKWHRYEPDFVLADFGVVVEIKGLWAVRSNHANVREKFEAARARFGANRFVMMTEKELKSDYLARLYRTLVYGH